MQIKVKFTCNHCGTEMLIDDVQLSDLKTGIKCPVCSEKISENVVRKKQLLKG